MTKSCSTCGAISGLEARFCRLCGAPFSIARRGGEDFHAPVSPLAETVPLIEEGRSTENLVADEPRRRAPETSKLSHTDIETLLRRPQLESHIEPPSEERRNAASNTALSERPPAARAALPTAALVAPAGLTTQQAAAFRSKALRFRWINIGAVLLLLAAAIGLFGFLASRRYAPQNLSVAGTIPVSDKQASVDAPPSKPATLPDAGDAEAASKSLRENVKLAPAKSGSSSANTATKTVVRDERANAPSDERRQEFSATIAPAALPSQPLTRQPAAAASSAVTTINKNRVTRSATNDPDAFYTKGLSILNGREPKALQRAEVGQALLYFQFAAQPGGAHREQAQKYADRLGKEFDKRRAKDKH